MCDGTSDYGHYVNFVADCEDESDEDFDLCCSLNGNYDHYDDFFCENGYVEDPNGVWALVFGMSFCICCCAFSLSYIVYKSKKRRRSPPRSR